MAKLISYLKIDISDINEFLELKYAIYSIKSSTLQQRIKGISELYLIIERPINGKKIDEKDTQKKKL